MTTTASAEGVGAPPPPPELSCAELATILTEKLDAAKIEVDAEEPDAGTTATALSELRAVAAVLEAQGCLPAVPPEPDTELTPCLELTAKLHAHVHTAVSLLITAEPDYVKLGVEVDGGIAVTAELTAAECVAAEEPEPEPEPANK